jgi:hypothetical protein
MQRPGLYIVLTLVLQVNNLNGQSLVGAYGGFNLSTFHQQPTTLTHYYEADFESKGSYLLGMHYKRRIASLFHLSLSLDYLLRKMFLDFSYGGRGGQSYHEYNVDIHSVNLRILPGLRLGKNSGIYINAGPYVGYIICSRKDGKYWYRSSYEDPHDGTVSGSARDLFKGFDIGFCTSLGIEIPVCKTVLLLPEAGYSMGLNNIGNGVFEDTERLNSSNIHLTLGVVYTLE